MFAQLVWLLWRSIVASVWPTSDVYMLVSLIGFTALAATRGRSRELSMLLRVYVLATGALALINVDTSRVSIDALLARTQWPRRGPLVTDSRRGGL